MALNKETIDELDKLVFELNSKFVPPELIVGCQVKDITDKDLFATNNGFIEAVVGKNNQQRCRYRGNPPDIAVDDVVDVLYFKSFRVFVIFSQGGDSVIANRYLPAGGTADQILTKQSASDYDVGWEDNSGSAFLDGVTKTVAASGGDFTTIQDAIDFFDGKLCRDCVIDVEDGTYNENLVADGFLSTNTNGVEIRGDTRPLAGVSFVDSSAVSGTDSLAGDGTISLSNSGVTITVTRSITNPDFTGWGSGDKVWISGNAGGFFEYTISSVASNVITLTSVAPTVGNAGSCLILTPSVKIDPGSGTPITVRNRGLSLVGLAVYIDSDIGVSIKRADGNSLASGNNILFAGNSAGYGIVVYHASSAIFSDCSFIDLAGGIRPTELASITANYSGFINCTVGVDAFFYGQASATFSTFAVCGTGATGRISGQANVSGSFAIGCTSYGYNANGQGVIWATKCAAINCATGYYATQNSWMYAGNTNANNSGNTTNYSPATSNTEGNIYAIITWS